MSAAYSIKMAAQQAGLSPHLIRAWERRYQALTPARTGTNRRAYSDSDVERLQLLNSAVRAGHLIGHIARLPDEELRTLITPARASVRTTLWETASHDYLGAALRAALALDQEGIDAVLTRARLDMGTVRFLHALVVPLMREIGEAWHRGDLRVGHEHLATAAVRTHVGRIITEARVSVTAPLVVVATPSGQAHEMGALVAAATAAQEGWRVRYLGPGVPAEEITAVAEQCHARTVLLGITYPPDDPRLASEIVALGELLPTGTAIVVGGQSAPAYARALGQARATLAGDMGELSGCLRALRQPGRLASSDGERRT